MAVRLKDLGSLPEEEEIVPPVKSKKTKPTYEELDPPKAAKAPMKEVIAPEYEATKLHYGQLEFIALARIVMDTELQTRLWPLLEEGHFAADASSAIFKRLKTLHSAGKEWPTLSSLAMDPALPPSARTQLVSFVSKLEHGLDAYTTNFQLGEGREVPLGTSQDIETHVYEILDASRVTRKALEGFVEVFETIGEDKNYDPLSGPALVEAVANATLGLRGKEAVADGLVQYGYGTSAEDARKREASLNKMFATDRPRVKTGWTQLDNKTGGFQPGEVVLLGGSTGSGKCLTGEALVPTSYGLLSMEELSVRLAIKNGGYTNGYMPAKFKVSGRNGHEPTSQVYKETVGVVHRLKTALGFDSTATGPHRVLAIKDGVIDWEYQHKLTPGDALVVQIGQELWGSETELRYTKHSKIESQGYTRYEDNPFPTHMTEELAGVLGYLVSEGCFNHGMSFTNYDSEVMSQFIGMWNKALPGEPSRLEDEDTSLVFSTRLQAIQFWEELGFKRGLSADREIPLCVRAAPRHLVIAFLRTLFEGDGYIQNDAAKTVFYVTTSKKLHDQVKVLLCNLGILTNSVYSTKHATNGKPGNSSYAYVLEISHKYVDVFAREVGFCSSTKKEQLRKCLLRGGRVSVGRKTEYLHGVMPAIEKVFGAVKHLMTERGLFMKHMAHGKHGHERVRMAIYRKKVTKLIAETLVNEADHFGISLPEVETLRYLAKDNIAVDVVKSVTRLEGPVVVYDFVVPGTNSFAANGLIQHNTVSMLSMMVNQARMGISCAMLQLELTKEQLNERLASNIATIDSEIIRTGKTTQRQQEAIRRADEEFDQELKQARSRFTVFAPSSATIQDCENVFKAHKYQVWYIDYVNLLKDVGGGSGKSGEDWMRLSDIVKDFKRLAKKYHVVIVLAVQVNIDKDNGQIEIRYAKAMKEHADVVIVWNLTAEARKEGVVWFNHLKARQYEPFDWPMRVVFKYCRFESFAMSDIPKAEDRVLGAKAKKRKIDAEDAIENLFPKKKTAAPKPASETDKPATKTKAPLIQPKQSKAPVVAIPLTDDNEQYANLDD